LFLSSNNTNELVDLLPNNFFKGHYTSVLIRVNNVTKETCMLLEKMGINEVYLGCENADDRILTDMNKRITFKDTLNAIKIFKENLKGINLSGLWIVGFPTEDSESVNINFKAIRNLIMNEYLNDVDPNLFVPHPGTHIYRFPNKYGMRILHNNWREYDYHRKPVFNGKNLNSTEIWQYYLNIYNLIVDSESDKFFVSKSKRSDFNNTAQAFSRQLKNRLKEFNKRKWGSEC